MAAPRREWLECFAQLLAGVCGISLTGERTDVMPYNPAYLEALANSGKDWG